MRILLITYLKKPDWIIKQLDIEEEFLEVNLDESIYVRLPQGSELITKRNRKFGILNKSIYGLVQDERQFHKELSTYLTKKLKLIQNTTEQCLLKLPSNNMFIGTYVDDLLIIEEKKLVDYFVTGMMDRFKITIEDQVKKFIGCELTWGQNKENVLLRQKVIIQNINDHFYIEIKTMRKHDFPSLPGRSVLRKNDGDPLLTSD